MSAARHRHTEMGSGLFGESGNHLLHSGGQLTHRIAQVQPNQRCDLIISGPPGAQPATEIGTDNLDQPALQRAVDVLVGFHRSKGPRCDLGRHLVQSGDHVGELVVGQQPRAVQGTSVCPGAGDVVRSQSPIKLGGPAEVEQRHCGISAEPTAPQPACTFPQERLASRRAAILLDNPYSSMKPRAWDWSKTSPSSYVARLKS